MSEDWGDWTAGPKAAKPKKARPQWLQFDPLHKGPCRGSSQHLIDTPFHKAECSRCKATVLQGYSCGIPTRLDPRPLTLAGEIEIVAAGIPTFELQTSEYSRWVYAEFRSSWEIGLDAKRGRPTFVLPIHRCGGNP